MCILSLSFNLIILLFPTLDSIVGLANGEWTTEGHSSSPGMAKNFLLFVQTV
jgi:hypothetical protein